MVLWDFNVRTKRAALERGMAMAESFNPGLRPIHISVLMSHISELSICFTTCSLVRTLLPPPILELHREVSCMAQKHAAHDSDPDGMYADADVLLMGLALKCKYVLKFFEGEWHNLYLSKSLVSLRPSAYVVNGHRPTSTASLTRARFVISGL